VEQYWRDNRLNMIHEGTHGIQALDLLGRKVRMDEGRCLALLVSRMTATARHAYREASTRVHAAALEQAVARLCDATQSAWRAEDPAEALANATPYLQAFGHVVVAWLWLDVCTVACERSGDGNDDARAALLNGKRQACAYFFAYELPKIDAWLRVVEHRDPTCRNMQEAWF
jgi:butyryl-CoA dehydrogenase